MRGISSLIDGDMEDSVQFVDENMILSTASESELPKKPAARTKNADNRVSKPKAAPRKPNAVKEDGVKKAASKSAGTKRKAVEEQGNDEDRQSNKRTFSGAVAQSEDELEAIGLGGKAKKEGAAKPKRKAKAKKETVECGNESDQVAVVAPQLQMLNDGKRAKAAQKAIAVDPQQLAQDIDSNTEAIDACSPQRPVKKVAQSTSQLRQDNLFRRRAGSASDTERGGGDPNLRRKLGDITRRFENIDLKYRNLKDVGILEANANMEKLRKQCESTTSASAELIASLKKELGMQMPLAHEARQLQLDLQTSKADATKYRSTVSELESSLATAQNEIKVLQAKLAAARNSATSVESATARTPGSAMKNSGQARTVMIGSAEAAQAAQTAQLKEDLYSDLTGLIIRSVKRIEDGDAYDCIQTGRNGSEYHCALFSKNMLLTLGIALHFKLVVESDSDGRTTSFEDTEFLYTPLLDSNRDKEMLELLPYYLKEDITFNRHHAAKFYSRVVDALTKKMLDD
jgi:Chromosome segregation protein Csm1/Pcs1